MIIIINYFERDELIGEVLEMLASKDFYIYKARFMLYPTSIYIYIVNPKNPSQVDLYYYNLGVGSWTIRPEKLKAKDKPMEGAILLSDINFDVYKKIVATSVEILKDMGDYNEYITMNDEVGIKYVSIELKGEYLFFKARLKGVREDI